MSQSNQSIVIHAAGDLRMEARDVPQPGPGEILVVMQAGGICGSDLHYYQNGEDEAHLDRLKMLDELKQAISDDDGQLFMTYQPKLHLHTQKITMRQIYLLDKEYDTIINQQKPSQVER